MRAVKAKAPFSFTDGPTLLTGKLDWSSRRARPASCPTALDAELRALQRETFSR